MSNAITLFSAAITNVTLAEKAWLEAQLEVQTAADDESSFAWSFEQRSDSSTYLHLYADPEFGGDIDRVADFAQKFLAEWRPDEVFALEFANVADSSSFDSTFGGGAVLITATEQRWLNTGLWLAQQKAPN
jgi:hypothetical protein